MKKNKDINEMTFEEIKAEGLCEISKDDYDTMYAKILAKNPKELKAYKKYIVSEYNKTGDVGVFLEELKILAKVEGITELSKKVNMKRPNIYQFLSKDSNPSFKNLKNIAGNLGIDVKFAVAS
jgi:probable addiction module antidote protein